MEDRWNEQDNTLMILSKTPLRAFPPAKFITREALEETVLRAINEGRDASDASRLASYVFVHNDIVPSNQSVAMYL